MDPLSIEAKRRNFEQFVARCAPHIPMLRCCICLLLHEMTRAASLIALDVGCSDLRLDSSTVSDVFSYHH